MPNGKNKVLIQIVPNDKVQNLQEKIQNQYGIPVPEQRLEYNGKLMNDPSKSLVQDLGIEHGDTIQMKPMEVIVRDVESGREFTVGTDPSHTVGDLKRKIQDQEGIPKANQRLIFGTKPLTSDIKTLRSYGIIKHGSILDLDPMIVHVETPDGKRIPVQVRPNDTIANVKEKMEEKNGIPAKEHVLNFNGKELPDTSMLQDHEIQHGDTVQLAAAGMNIFVKDWKHKTTRLDVKPSDTVQLIRERLKPIKDLDPKNQILSYKDTMLDDNDMSLADYKIPNGAYDRLGSFQDLR